MSIYRILLVSISAAGALAVSTATARAQVPGQLPPGQLPGQFPGQFQGQIPPGLLLLRGAGFPGVIGNQQGRPPVNNNMGAFGGFRGGVPIGNRLDFRTTMPFPSSPPLTDNPNQQGRNTTIYKNLNTSYLGGLGAGQTAAVNQFGQFGQFGGAPTGGFNQPNIVFGQMVPTGSSGQFGQFGQFGQTNNPGQVGTIGGVGGKFGANGFAQIGGGGQFGSRYGL